MVNRRGGNEANDTAETANRADVLEQRTELDDSEDEEVRPRPDDASSRGEASEADAAEQRREVSTDEDEYR